MTLAKCLRCGASSNGGTFEVASLLIDHAAGLSRGIPCGDDYNCVEEIIDTVVDTVVPESTTQDETPKSEEASYKKVEDKSGEHVIFDKVKQSKNKFK